ncbi:MAG TPA: NmrA family NAD(P)-binding protein [Thermoanaerobaculia bacterium]
MTAPVLVVGSTGQLGTAVVDRLRAAGHPVRALVRPSSPRAFEPDGVELAFGDLRDPESLVAACRGVERVVATANAVVPRGRASFEEVESTGYDNLVDACKAEGVRRILFMSVAETALDKSVTTYRLKRQTENRIRGSGLAYSFFRGAAFMDDWFALMGSSIPLRGAKAHTLRRPFWFAKGFLSMAATSIERRGFAIVPGDGTTRHAYVALDDVAAILAAAAAAPEDGENLIANLGGPEVLTAEEVVAIFARVLGRPIRIVHAPAKVYRVLADVFEPFSPQAGNLMAMSWAAALSGFDFDGRPLAERFGVRLTTAEEFLRAKAGLPEET